MSKLVIVESPAKARTIGKMLGKDYKVLASMGHVRDLPERELGVDIKNRFEPVYVDTPRSKSTLKDLRAAAKDVDEVFLAPDPDREGEAIAWHLHEVLKKDVSSPFYRVTFHEITNSAITKAMQELGEINMNLVDSQQARRVLDRIVGYQVSPLLWSKIEKGCSAGRVQSAALRLVVERERVIENFKPEEYWVFGIICTMPDGSEIAFKLFKINAADVNIGNEAEALAVLDAVKNGSIPRVESITSAERKRYAPAPFTTSTLQQSASVSLHFSASNTMRYAQQLYEGIELGAKGAVGLITYMRTDSVTIAAEAQYAALDFIRKEYGDTFAPKHPNVYKNKAAAQEAHEAIRPTDVLRTPEMMAQFLDEKQLKLYTLIWRRFVASQMTPAISNLTTVDLLVTGADRKGYTFRATAAVPVFAGFSKVYEDVAKKKDETALATALGSLQHQQELTISDFEKEQKFTEPPPRFTEASLIKELEENGIGRPSTYATILKTIQDRDYVSRDNGKLVPTALGLSVNDFLVERLPELFDIGFTAKMEQQLDEIEEGNVSWIAMMDEFYNKFAPWLEDAKHSDAPPAHLSKLLMDAIAKVEFEKPQKSGRRTFDDRKFFESVRKKFEADGKITGKQYTALLNIAGKYLAQLDLSVFPDDVIAEVKALAVEKTEREQAVSDADYVGLFANFGSNIQFEEPVKRGKFTYDDRKFFDSLQQQALSGKPLSEKQLSALCKLVHKYAAQLKDKQSVFAQLNLTEAAAPSTGDGDDPAAPSGTDGNAKTEALFKALENVTAWAEPVKRGRFTYDDKAFYQSLSKQFHGGRQLSDKQLSALSKLAEKYIK